MYATLHPSQLVLLVASAGPPLQLRALAHRPNLELAAVLLQDALVVVFPEGLGGVLAGEALEDLGASGVLVEEL